MMFNGNRKIPTPVSIVPEENEAVKFHEYIPYGLGVMSRAWRMYYSHGWILGKESLLKNDKPELSSLFPTHRLNMI